MIGVVTGCVLAMRSGLVAPAEAQQLIKLRPITDTQTVGKFTSTNLEIFTLALTRMSRRRAQAGDLASIG